MKSMFEGCRQEVQALIDCIRVGVFITDEKGDVIMLNRESAGTGRYGDTIIGKNVFQLTQSGYMSQSAVGNALTDGKEASVVQELDSGEALFITAVPCMENGQVRGVIATERDVTEARTLREQLIEKEAVTEKYEKELAYLRGRQSGPENGIIMKSRAMQRVVELACRVAGLDTTVLIRGESGTGKELIASLIHRNSPRNTGPCIKVNCAAIPENLLESELFGYERGAFTGANACGRAGMFELADHGTLFLDEIGELTPRMQSKLLRVLQEKTVLRIGGSQPHPADVRIITATNLDLEEAVAKGIFRADLYYRLNVLLIELPPLRKRKEDIPVLARFFVEEFNRTWEMKKVLQEGAVRTLEEYAWPGNVRELRNIIERVMISFDSGEITAFQIRSRLYRRESAETGVSAIFPEGTLEERMAAFEKELLKQLLQEHRMGSAVAKILGINKSTISRKLKKYQISLEKD